MNPLMGSAQLLYLLTLNSIPCKSLMSVAPGLLCGPSVQSLRLNRFATAV